MADDWKYEVEDFEDADDEDSDGQATDVFGDRGSGGIEPESPTLENALFVILGVVIALLVIIGV
ncbi:MAG TPA: hypothetical protein VFJ06_14745 [Halococcus sp.]|nr:hypothetical protein [Halococcus sp.]